MNSKSILFLLSFSLLVTACNKSSLRTQPGNSTSLDLNNGLVAYYPFNGNADDASGDGYDAVVSGATLAANRFGDSSEAYEFNGLTAYLRYEDILDEIFCAPVAKFSVCGWAKVRSTGSSYYGGGFIIGKNAGGTVGPYQWSVSYVDGQVVAQVFFDTAAANYVTLTSPMATNRWFHFVLVFDGSLAPSQRLALYVDGQSFNDSPLRVVGAVGVTTVNSQQHLAIGATHYANTPQSPEDFFNGFIDDIRIYDRPLSQAEVQALYLETE